MTTGVICPVPILSFLDNQGNPAVGGSVLTQVGGSNTATYQDVGLTTSLPNPIPLNSRGEVSTSGGASAQCFLTPNIVYTFTLYDVNGTQLWVATYVNGVQMNAESIGMLIYPLTAAEVAAGVTPTTYAYPEGDIRRYGALTTATDNTTAINAALLVSSDGGNAAFIPGGTWAYITSLTVAAASSIYGVGRASILAPQDVDGMTFLAGTSYGTTAGVTRFFRDFQLNNSNSTNSTKAGIVINFTAASGDRVTNAHFDRLYISNFNTAVYIRGLWNSAFNNCFTYNCYLGLYFVGQNIKNDVNACSFIRGTMTGATTSAGFSFSSTAGETTQSTRLYGGTHCYGFERGVNAVLALELQIEHCDFSQCLETGVLITIGLGGIWVRDCWIEVNTSTAVRGITVSDLAVVNYGDIHLIGNHITNSYTTGTVASKGIYVGYNQIAVTVHDNAISGFDQGIDTNAVSGANVNFSIKNNRADIITPVYNAGSFPFRLHTNCGNSEVGPNYVQFGVAQAATMAASANITVPDSTLFPVATPVQFDDTQNGVTQGVTYFVKTSAANVITIAPVAGGTAIVGTGATAINIMQAPLQLEYSSTTPSGVKFFGTGAFIGTFTGFAANKLGVVKWTCDGSKATLDASTASIFDTSTTTAMTLTGVPAMLAPPTAKGFGAIVLDNSVRDLGYSTITATTITFSKDMSGAALTAANNKGVVGDFATWSIN